MGTKKTHDDYAALILQSHVELSMLPVFHSDYNKIHARLSRQLTKWADRLNILVQVASNEQTEWTADELGYTCIPMSTKAECGALQVADYQAFLEDYNQYVGLLVERKGCTRKGGRMVGCDLYSTFSNEDNRSRFMAEVERFKSDNRFNQMILISECSHGEYLSFRPSFNGKHYNTCNYGMNVPARRATIAKLHAVGCPVFFAGTRQAAVEMYRDFIIQWCRENYIKILNIEK